MSTFFPISDAPSRCLNTGSIFTLFKKKARILLLKMSARARKTMSWGAEYSKISASISAFW
jgi:hypothetical protein